MKSDLERALEALAGKQSGLERLWDYYYGRHPLVYANEQLRQTFRNTSRAQFVANWTAVVVDTVHDRINLSGFETQDDAAQQALNELFEASEMGLIADEVHEAALVLGEAYIIVWPNEEGRPQPYYNDARLCHIFYDPEYPTRILYAAKWWTDEEKWRHLTLYYADRIEHYLGGNSDEPNPIYQPDPELAQEDNPYGRVPVFRFTQQRSGKSDLSQILPLQDALNKLLSDMMRAAEVAAYRQRWMITDADTSRLINAPNGIWTIPAGGADGTQPAQVGEFSETSLANFLDAIDRLAMAVGVISRTPKHYFFGQNGTPSGEALAAMEAPLNKKAADYEERYASTWRQVAAFMLRLAGKGEIAPQRITPKWAGIETVQAYTTAQSRQLGVTAGIPLVTLLRREGWSQAELEQMGKDMEEANGKGASGDAQRVTSQ